jgi:hypothetical protein
MSVEVFFSAQARAKQSLEIMFPVSADKIKITSKGMEFSSKSLLNLVSVDPNCEN